MNQMMTAVLLSDQLIIVLISVEPDVLVSLIILFSWTGYLTVPGLRELDGSTRSSLSEASGVSGASTRTYVNDASTLVLETIENGVKK
jgi:hypothetical protein